jgi:UDP-N-acetylmuramate: L-alanyl-gamma-D-glutamyl-meso-diaminopimelate ligase
MAGNIPEGERLHPERVVETLRASGKSAQLCTDADAIVAEIAGRAKAGDVVAILSNGGFGGIYKKLPAAIAAQRSAL